VSPGGGVWGRGSSVQKRERVSVRKGTGGMGKSTGTKGRKEADKQATARASGEKIKIGIKAPIGKEKEEERVQGISSTVRRDRSGSYAPENPAGK